MSRTTIAFIAGGLSLTLASCSVMSKWRGDPPSSYRFEKVSYQSGPGPEGWVYRDRWSGECLIGQNGGAGGLVMAPRAVCEAKPHP